LICNIISAINAQRGIRRIPQGSAGESEAFNGSVILCTREEPSTKENIVLKMQGVGLDKKDMFGKSDPYIIILRRNERGKWEQCYQSEVVKKTLAPDWKPLLISLDRLCDGNLDGDTVDPDIDDVIGEFITTARFLLTCTKEGRDFEVNVKVSISSNACSFLDYILSGLKLTLLFFLCFRTSINVVVGIDLSNQIRQSNSLKGFTEAISFARSAAVNSEYIIAIQAVVEILQVYDSDELFPAFGFGTRVGSDGRKSHLFPLTGDLNNPNCEGVSGVLAAYSRVANETYGSAPPNFAPLIKHVNEMARTSRDSSKYFVLLILTTGLVDDWVETQRAVIEASFLPISIIFIGVGGRKFEELQVLDQDFALLKIGQEEACRDNVQFVEMRRFLRLAADGSEEIRWNKLGLAKEVLAELPTQMMNYFVKQRLLPLNKIPYRPERTEQLVDPSWWHSYMQPLHQRPLNQASHESSHQEHKLRFQSVDCDSEEHEDVSELPNIASNSGRSQTSRKISPEAISESSIRRNRLIEKMRRELSFEDSSVRRGFEGGNRQITCEVEEGSESCLNPQEDQSSRMRHHSWRERPERTVSGGLSQKTGSHRHSEDLDRKKLPHLGE
uniref:Copine domain-containing protein n=2 Tax=Hymenolepis diminuta TaxID=6216 RepID=A0A158QBQ5_HYMDI